MKKFVLQFIFGGGGGGLTELHIANPTKYMSLNFTPKKIQASTFSTQIMRD